MSWGSSFSEKGYGLSGEFRDRIASPGVNSVEVDLKMILPFG